MCRRTSLQKRPRETGAGCKRKAPWEEEKISEIQRRKDGKEIKEILENWGQGARTDFPDFV